MTEIARVAREEAATFRQNQAHIIDPAVASAEEMMARFKRDFNLDGKGQSLGKAIVGLPNDALNNPKTTSKTEGKDSATLDGILSSIQELVGISAEQLGKEPLSLEGADLGG